MLEERKPQYYAIQHLHSGYDLVENALSDLVDAGHQYNALAEKSVPKIREALSKEVKRQMTLSETITNYLGDSYNLNLLCHEMLEHFFTNKDMRFLSSDLYAGPTKEYWEIGLGPELLSRTRDKLDADRLRESAMVVLADKATKKDLERLAHCYLGLYAALSAFKAGINDLVNEIDFGLTIKGECDICSALSSS